MGQLVCIEEFREGARGGSLTFRRPDDSDFETKAADVKIMYEITRVFR